MTSSAAPMSTCWPIVSVAERHGASNARNGRRQPRHRAAIQLPVMPALKSRGQSIDIPMNGFFQENGLAHDVLSTLLRRARDGGLCFRACRGWGCNNGHRGRAVDICSIMQADGFRGAPRTCTPIVVSATGTPASGTARTAGARRRSWPCGSRRSTRTGRSRRGAWSTRGRGVRRTDRAHRCSWHHRAHRPRRRYWRRGVRRTDRAHRCSWHHRAHRPRRRYWRRGVRRTDRAHRCSWHHRAHRPRRRYWRRGVQRIDRERRRTRTRRADRAGGTQRRHGIPRGTRTRGCDGLRWYQWISGSYWTRGRDGVRRTGRPDGPRRV